MRTTFSDESDNSGGYAMGCMSEEKDVELLFKRGDKGTFCQSLSKVLVLTDRL